MNIPYQNMEIEQIYTQLLSDKHASIAICSAEAGEGVTSLAFALAQRSLLAGHSTLLVDLNLYRPALKSLLDIESQSLTAQYSGQSKNRQLITTNILPPPQLICSEQIMVAINGVIAPSKREHIMKLRQPGVIEQCISEWLKSYDTVIIDTSPLNRVNAQNIPAERVAAACDGALLTVLAGQTTEASINSAHSKLDNAKAKLFGSVINDRDNPTLRDELLREVRRMEPLFSWLSKPLKKIINRNRLLTLEI
ncbi:MAG: CpsD/CapB family tyrosine-protein kinase [Psychromonas sp.]|nr:CpsD/CapB family tyrosine-protein kinase [Alteromonadales bacterium]MCP5079809.1 CpsD/CapB family tyrosine-protein kinase [Psychromonas sp.]